MKSFELPFSYCNSCAVKGVVCMCGEGGKLLPIDEPAYIVLGGIPMATGEWVVQAYMGGRGNCFVRSLKWNGEVGGIATVGGCIAGKRNTIGLTIWGDKEAEMGMGVAGWYSPTPGGKTGSGRVLLYWARLFWNQVFICLSVILKDTDKTFLSAGNRYCWSWKRCSSACICSGLNLILPLRELCAILEGLSLFVSLCVPSVTVLGLSSGERGREGGRG